MTDQLRPLAFLHRITAPKPPYITARTAAANGSLKAEKLYGDWWTTPEQYQAWLAGWPHPVGRKPAPERARE